MITLAAPPPDSPAVAALRSELARACAATERAQDAACRRPSRSTLAALEAAAGYERGMREALRLITSR